MSLKFNLEMVDYLEKLAGLKCSFDTKFNSTLEPNKTYITQCCQNLGIKEDEYLNVAISIVRYIGKHSSKTMHNFDKYTDDTKSVHFQEISEADIGKDFKYTKEIVRGVYNTLIQHGSLSFQ
jgi:hypothetical protein